MCENKFFTEPQVKLAHLEKDLTTFIEKDRRYKCLKQARQRAEEMGGESTLHHEFLNVCKNLEKELENELTTLADVIAPYRAHLMIYLARKDEERRAFKAFLEKRNAIRKMRHEKKKVLVLRKKMPTLPSPPEEEINEDSDASQASEE